MAVKITIYKEDGTKLGSFYIPKEANKEWVEKNVPPIIQAARLLAGEIEKTGY